MLLIFFFFSVSQSSHCQDFSYEITRDKSVSKFQRINHIETYLGNFNKQMEKFSSDLKKEDTGFRSKLDKRFEELSGRLKKLKSEVEQLKTEEIPELKKSVGGEELKELKEKVNAQEEEIKKLKENFDSLESVLKSLNELLKVNGSVKTKP
jgi:chromosome segregation ATPase